MLYGSATSPGRFNGAAKQTQPGTPTRQALTSVYQSYEAEEYDYQLGASLDRVAGGIGNGLMASSNGSGTGGAGGFSGGRPLTACGAPISTALLPFVCVYVADWCCCVVVRGAGDSSSDED